MNSKDLMRSSEMSSKDLAEVNDKDSTGNVCHGSSNHSYLSKPLDIEEFRKHAHTMVDFISDYYQKVENFPVLSQVKPGYLRSLLPDSAPKDPDSLENLFSDIEEKIIPGLTHWQSPNFYGYFPAGLSTASFLGEMLSSGFAVVNLTWMTSPVATELENIVCDWLGKMLNLPASFLSCSESGGGGVIQVSASEGILLSVLAARNKAWSKIGEENVERLVVYVSDQTHSSVEKACKIAGIYENNVRILPTSSSTNYALSMEVVREYIMKDIQMGFHPTYICGTIGTTSSAAVDPISKLAKIAQEYDMWFHVDGAYGGCACICPEYQHYLEGMEDADSFGTNPHKWLLTNFDCSILWIKNSKSLIEALSSNPEFLKNKVSESNQVPHYKDWQVHLGSRFRSLKLWMVLHLYGTSNLQAYIRNHIYLAQYFEDLMKEDGRFEVMARRTFALVCFRLSAPSNDPDDGNTLNSYLLDVVNESGYMYMSHTVLSGKYTLRFCVGGVLTERQHVDATWKLLREKATIILRDKTYFYNSM